MREGMGANRMEARIWREGWQRKYSSFARSPPALPFGIALMPAVRIMSPDANLQAFRGFGVPDHDPDPELYESKGGEWGYLMAAPSSSTMRCASTWFLDEIV